MTAKNYILNLLPSHRFYAALSACALLFFVSYFLPILYNVAAWLTALVLAATLADYVLLFFSRGSVVASRHMAPRFSLGDENEVDIVLENRYNFKVWIRMIDELPDQFQERKLSKELSIGYRSTHKVKLLLRPISRGIFSFGHIQVYACSPLQLLSRRFTTASMEDVKVYPSFRHLRQQQLMALSDMPAYGSRKVRRLGHSMEFEKIKEYVQGDDVRTINWKATARRGGGLMVNTYTDARQQQIYCLLDKGRSMRSPFDGMTLLGHSINAALALLNIAILKGDRAGLVTFSQKINDVVAAERLSTQIPLLLETLYRQQTDYQESDYEALVVGLHRRLNQRALLLLFTNFETLASLQRQLPYLRRLATRHLLCVVFFQNTLLEDLRQAQPENTEGIYVKTIANQFDYEKRLIIKELRKHGILSILTTPQSLSVDVINRYLELKARQMV